MAWMVIIHGVNYYRRGPVGSFRELKTTPSRPLEQLREVVVHARHAEIGFVPERTAQFVNAVLPAIGELHD